ncbi:MAG: class I SAM-dependent methyltransferase [Actinobacteria bacterium]|nr:class I SAM-dependent methyltransferase [Actinomycetota bacterium]
MEMQAFEKWVLAGRAWRAFSRRVVVPWLISYADLPPQADVLELGAGAGADAAALAERFPGWRLTATDFDPEMVELARPRLARFGDRVRVEQADATALRYPDASFDLVIAMLVWHHVGIWETATTEARRVLRPGGWLVLADVLDPWRFLRVFGTYTLPELRDAVAKAGFRRWRIDTGLRPWYRMVAEAP